MSTMKMTSQQQQHQSSHYPNLLTTLQQDIEQKSAGETSVNPRTHHSKDNSRPSSFQTKNIFYNSNHRHHQQLYFTRPPPHISPRRQQQSYYPTYDRFHYHHQHQPIRPLMEIKDNLFSSHHDLDDTDKDNQDDEETKITHSMSKQREPKQRGQYRNRKAELDWDHAFDLDLIDLYSIQPDPDSRSLTSTISSSDHSFSSF